MTKQRQLILDIINRSYSHPNADEIYKEAKIVMPNIALGTVYRNLGLMVKDGEIRRLVCENAPDRYDRVAPLHDHMLCTECGKITDTDIGSLWDTIENCVGEKIVGYELMVRHVCNSCKSEQN
ncbi:MAG: transcriptional repressor [Ruminococcaceae bacterium]|nr:transcriptional repressor [Oscillospiraceae bacterium]